MNNQRAMQMVLRLLFRQVSKYLAKGGTNNPQIADAAKRLKMGRRFGRF